MLLAREVPRSSAYGYAQALDGTWDDYRQATGRRGADRDDFADASDFIGWYMNEAAPGERLAPHDAYNQYLAYPEGKAGYARGSYRARAVAPRRGAGRRVVGGRLPEPAPGACRRAEVCRRRPARLSLRHGKRARRGPWTG